MAVFVLASDWDAGHDPVTTFPADSCLNLNNQTSMARNRLTETERKSVPDCDNNIPYNVALCQVTP
jgi:hypothetical protein